MSQAKTILVVDDDQMLREGLQVMLQKQGYRTLEADDGRIAQQMIEGQHPDLVILDMMMARWGGFAVLEHFQNRSDAPPFIMITAQDGEKHEAYAHEVGVADYIRKPFTLERLLRGVEQALGKAPVESEEAPALRVCCPGCGARIKAPLQMVGQTRPCPRCKATLTLKPQPPEDEGPALVPDYN